MKKFAVVISSLVDGATVSIQILVESEMTAKQLRSFYWCKGSVSVSDVYVEEIE